MLVSLQEALNEGKNASVVASLFTLKLGNIPSYTKARWMHITQPKLQLRHDEGCIKPTTLDEHVSYNNHITCNQLYSVCKSVPLFDIR